MLILLPPSESKATPGGGRRPFDLADLSWPELSAPRAQVLAELAQVSARPDALEVLKVGPSLVQEVAANRHLLSAPSAPASQVYTGVLYDAVNFSALPVAARRRAHQSVLIFSALWGVLRPGDRIPQYRLSMTAKLPGLSPLAGFWRQHLAPVLATADAGLVVDCRSASYQAAWVPGGTTQVVSVNVYREIRGRRTVVSHAAKSTRGKLANFLLERPGALPRTAQALAKAVGTEFPSELTPPTRSQPSWQLAIQFQE